MVSTAPLPADYDVDDRKAVRDSEYLRDWENAPKRFRNKAESLGLKAQVDEQHSEHVLEYDEHKSNIHDPGHAPSFYVPDMASELDTVVDRLVEKYGAQHEAMIQEIYDDLREPMEREIERNRSLMLGRVVMYLIKTESHKLFPRIHALVHSIPRLAAISGIGSMRDSARVCGVSPEWIRKARNFWRDALGIEIPDEGRKRPEACAKYSANGKTNHWRNKLFKPTTQPNICQPHPNQTPPLNLIPQTVAA